MTTMVHNLVQETLQVQERQLLEDLQLMESSKILQMVQLDLVELRLHTI